MKKIALIIGLLLSLQVVTAQRSPQFVSPDRLFYEAKAMYEDKNFAGCIDKINQYKQGTVNPNLKEDADYYLAASDFYQGKKEMDIMLKDFLDTYPGTHHRNEIYFMIASDHFAREEYRQAIYWFDQVNVNYLSNEQWEDRDYRLALSYLKTDKNEDTFVLLNSLRRSSTKYRDPATYYLGYVAYTEGDYQNALASFNALKSSKEYVPEVLYYINQINFAQERYTQTINEGKTLISTYPTNPLNLEMERIIGISYYYDGNYKSATTYLSSYLDKATDAVSKDYYIAGSAYYNLGNYPQAIEYFNRSNPGDDELGQNINLYLGQAYLKTGDREKALLAFEMASMQDYNPGIKETAMYNYAMLLHQTSVSGFGESVTVLENFVNMYPNSEYADNVNDALVEVYLTTRNYETALASINKIRNPGNKILTAKQKIYYYLGTVDFTNNLYDSAIDNFTHAINMGNYAGAEKNKANYWRGESYYRKENYSEAIKNYNAYLQTGDRSDNLRGLAYYNIGYGNFKQEKFNEAQTAFQNFIKEGSSDSNTLADAYARLGDCYFYKRNFSEAERAYAQSASAMPSRADYVIFQEGYVAGLQKNYQGKIDKMNRLIRDFPNSSYVPDAMYEKGRSYVLMNKNTDAIDAYKTLIRQFPNNALARKAGLQVGLLYYNTDKPLDAITAYKDVISRYPGSEETKVALQDLRSIYMEMNQVDRYVEYVNSLGGGMQVNATEQDSLTYIAAERLFNGGDYKRAQEGMQKYLQSYPNGAFSTNAHYYLGSAYYRNNNYTSAKEELTKVLDRGDNQFTEPTLLQMADITYKEKDYKEALTYYERLESNASNKANRDLGGLGILRSGSQLKEHNTVVSMANKMLESNQSPEATNEILYYRAKALAGLGERTKAVADLETLSKDTRTNFGAEAKYQLALYYYNDKQNSKAKGVITDFVKEGTPHQYWLAKSYILMSDILAGEGDYLQAKQYLESLRNNYPNTNNDDIHAIIHDRLTTLENK